MIICGCAGHTTKQTDNTMAPKITNHENIIIIAWDNNFLCSTQTQKAEKREFGKSGEVIAYFPIGFKKYKFPIKIIYPLATPLASSRLTNYWICVGSERCHLFSREIIK